MRAEEKTAPEGTALISAVVGWKPFFASIVPASCRPVLKSHRHAIGLRDDERSQGRRMIWYFCGEGTGRRKKEMIVELSSCTVKGDASQGENMHDVRTLRRLKRNLVG